MPEEQLSWQPGFSLSRTPTKRPTVRRKRQQRFEFVEETFHSRASQIDKTHSDARLAAFRGSPIRAGTSKYDSPQDAAQEQGSIDDLSLRTWNNARWDMREGLSSSRAIGGTSDYGTDLISNNDEDISTSSHLSSHLAGDDAVPNAILFMASTDTMSFFSRSIPSTINYDSLTQRFKPILNRYNGEFCTIPLTFDLRINPFRYRTDIDPEPIFLVHAVMALAGHHVRSASTLSHRQVALQLLRQNLDLFSDTEAIFSMLDTIVILFSLDETQSMFGNWTTHLAGAYALLEACGGTKTLTMSSRLEAQTGILTWWDAIISLLSREECILPYEYFDAILSNQARREWDFFSLCGCPTSLAKIVMQVARLGAARQKQKQTGNDGSSSQTSILTIDNNTNTSISEIERELTSWTHIPAPTALQDEESMHKDRDTMHCSEAWRNGLLLYIFRVFYWEPGAPIPPHVTYRARVIMDHVTSCRDDEMISRQALFPLFLAGCELKDESSRRKIVDLCKAWDGRTRYHMFGDAVGLLEEVWKRQEGVGGEGVWWGQVVDGRHERMEMDDDQTCPLKMRLCFG